MGFNGKYLIPLAVTAVLTSGLTLLSRRSSPPVALTIARCLAVAVLGSEVAWWIYTPLHGRWSAAEDLPFHLSDMSPLVGAAALWFRRRLLVEVIYFWALSAGVQALITPSIGADFPSFIWFQYYAAHAGVVMAAFVLILGLRIHPAPGAVWRVSLVSLVYTLFVAGMDVLTGGDYMFLRQPPADPTLLSVMGPWPRYIFGGALVALVLFFILNLPFVVARRVAGPDGVKPGS